SAYSGHLHGQPQREKRTLPAPPWFVLRVILAVEVFVTERRWGVGRLPELSRAVMLLAIRRRKPNTTEPPSHLARKLLSQLIAESVGVFLLTTAPQVIEQTQELREAVRSRVNKKGTWGGPRKTKAQLEAMEKQRTQNAAKIGRLLPEPKV